MNTNDMTLDSLYRLERLVERATSLDDLPSLQRQATGGEHQVDVLINLTNLLDAIVCEGTKRGLGFTSFSDLNAGMGEPATDEDRRLVLEVIEEALVEVINPEKVACKFCSHMVPTRTAHLHQGGYVGDGCCWDERLRMSE